MDQIVRADRRKLQFEAAPEAEAEVERLAPGYLDLRIRLGRAFAEIDAKRSYLASGCASVHQYGARRGILAADVNALVALGRALDARSEEPPPAPPPEGDGESEVLSPPPTVEELVRAGQVSVQNATALGQLLADPNLVLPGEDWVKDAERLSPTAFRRKVHQRIEESAQREPTLPLRLEVTRRALEDFQRSRVIASSKAGLYLTRGQTLALLAKRYLAAEDPVNRGAHARRVGPTSERPGSRYIPAEVRREVRSRSGGCCEVGDCGFEGPLEFMHLGQPHSRNGSREADNLGEGCHRHHVMCDAGVIRFAGFEAGRPVFRTREGERLVRAGPPAPPRVPEEAPPAAEPCARGAPGSVSERPPPRWGRRALTSRPRAAPTCRMPRFRPNPRE